MAACWAQQHWGATTSGPADVAGHVRPYVVALENDDRDVEAIAGAATPLRSAISQRFAIKPRAASQPLRGRSRPPKATRLRCRLALSPVPAEPEPEPVRAVAAAGPLGPAVAAAAAPEHMRQGALAEVQLQALPYHGIARGEPVSRKRRTSGAPSLGYSWTRKILRSFFTEESNF
jgi:hypothetical protein